MRRKKISVQCVRKKYKINLAGYAVFTLWKIMNDKELECVTEFVGIKTWILVSAFSPTNWIT